MNTINKFIKNTFYKDIWYVYILIRINQDKTVKEYKYSFYRRKRVKTENETSWKYELFLGKAKVKFPVVFPLKLKNGELLHNLPK